MSTQEFWLRVAEISIQAAIFLVAIIAAYLAIEQIRQLSRSILLSHQANTIEAVSHCTNRYSEIMSAIPGNDSAAQEVRDWWYRYFDLQTEQFTYFRRGLLDPDIYELWMQELSEVYQSPPMNLAYLGTRRQRHMEYLNTYLPHNRDLNSFFLELNNISRMAGALRAAEMHELIGKHASNIGRNVDGR